MMLSVPPLPTTPQTSWPGVSRATASPFSMSSVMAMISASKRDWLGHMSRCSALTWE